MKDKKLFTIIGILCILLAIVVIVFNIIKNKPFSMITFLPLVFAVACLIVARSSK